MSCVLGWGVSYCGGWQYGGERNMCNEDGRSAGDAFRGMLRSRACESEAPGRVR